MAFREWIKTSSKSRNFKNRRLARINQEFAQNLKFVLSLNKMAFKKISIIFPVIIFLSLFLFNFSLAQREVEVPFPGLATKTPALPEYVEAIYRFALIISGVIVFGALVYGGFLYLTSAGNPARMHDAKDQISSAILGLIILFSAYLILKTINPELIMLSQPGVINGCGKACDASNPCIEGLDCKDGICQCPEGQKCVAGICTFPPIKYEPIEAVSNWNFSGGCATYGDPNTCNSIDINGDGNADCFWCAGCSGKLTNTQTGGVDTCLPIGSKCDEYSCVTSSCGATSCE